LDFVDNDDPAKFAEGEHGLFEPGEVRGIFKVEVVLRLRWHDRASKRGLPDLLSTHEKHDGSPSKRLSEYSLSLRSVYHALNYTRQIRTLNADLPGIRHALE